MIKSRLSITKETWKQFSKLSNLLFKHHIRNRSLEDWTWSFYYKLWNRKNDLGAISCWTVIRWKSLARGKHWSKREKCIEASEGSLLPHRRWFQGERACSLFPFGRQGSIMLPKWDAQRILREGFAYSCRKRAWFASFVASQSSERPGGMEKITKLLHAWRENIWL